jgi:hypothetical protein
MGPQDPGMSGRRRNAHPPDRSQVQDGYLRFLHVTCFGIVLSLAQRPDVTVANERPQAVGVAQLRGSLPVTRARSSRAAAPTASGRRLGQRRCLSSYASVLEGRYTCDSPFDAVGLRESEGREKRTCSIRGPDVHSAPEML